MSFIGETKQNSEVRWREHCSTKKTSEVVDHLLLQPGHINKCSEASIQTEDVRGILHSNTSVHLK